MMTIEPFKAEHLLEIDAQDAQATELGVAEAREHERSGACYTARLAGRIIMCGGVRLEGPAGFLWAIIARNVPMLVAHRTAQRFISMFPRVNLVATARCGFPAASRWLRMLGFKFTQTLPADALDGADQDLYYREAIR